MRHEKDNFNQWAWVILGYTHHMLRGLYVCWCRVHVASPGAVTLLAAATSASAVSAVFGRSENAINDEGNTTYHGEIGCVVILYLIQTCFDFAPV